MSSVRPVLPGMTYRLPPAQEKLNFFTFTKEEALTAFQKAKNQDFAKAILQVYQGFSPLLAREAAYYATGGVQLLKNEVSSFRMERLFSFLEELKERIAAKTEI